MLNFTLPSSHGNNFELAKCTKPIVVFFYPRDNTPGCSIENKDFAMLYPQFIQAGYEVVGISRDNLSSHSKFVQKFNLPFQLLADTEEIACNLFATIKNKKMYGKNVRGIERSTFILDKNKTIIQEWRKVSVANHAQEVLQFILSKTTQ